MRWLPVGELRGPCVQHLEGAIVQWDRAAGAVNGLALSYFFASFDQERESQRLTGPRYEKGVKWIVPILWNMAPRPAPGG
jgi:hypothetical protein